MRKISITAALTLVITMILTAAGCISEIAPCYALESENNEGEVLYGYYLEPPVEEEIYVNHETAGIAGRRDKHVIVLTASDPSSPMPGGSVNGTLEVKISGNTESGLGVMTFEHPGVYYYDVSRRNNNGDSDRSYRVMIAVYNDGSSDMVTWDMSDGSKVDEIKFTDSYRRTPKTGDDNSEIMLLTGVGSLSLAAIVLLLLKRRRLKDE